MEISNIVLKSRQMLSAFDGLLKKGHQLTIPNSTPTNVLADGQTQFIARVSTGADEAELNNKADLLLVSIYSLKENLKVWCKDKGIPFNGENLINTYKDDVALVHDLHNVRKHGKLNRPPRSGRTPELKILGEAVPLIKYGTTITMNLREDGTMSASIANPDGSPADISLNARIFDEAGNNLGDFVKICDKAIELWTKELRNAGVPV